MISNKKFENWTWFNGTHFFFNILSSFSFLRQSKDFMKPHKLIAMFKLCLWEDLLWINSIHSTCTSTIPLRTNFILDCHLVHPQVIALLHIELCLLKLIPYILCTIAGADKSLARPGRKQARKHVRDARDFNNIETRAVINFFSYKTRRRREFTPFWHTH